MNYPQTVEELTNWIVHVDHDRLGDIHIITGYENTGCCFWCGNTLTGRQVRYCTGHWRYYYNYFSWAYARDWCAARYYYQCANCGTPQHHYDHDLKRIAGADLEVHHIIPLEGNHRAWSVYNVPWNLVCLCHRCHLLVHAVMRENARSAVLDVFDLAMARGQSFFPSMV